MGLLDDPGLKKPGGLLGGSELEAASAPRGLLDGLLGGSIEDPRTAATLAFAKALLTPTPYRRGAMAGLVDGMGAYQMAMADGRRQQTDDRLKRLQMEHSTLGVQQGHLQLAQMQQQAARQNAIRDALSKAETGGQLATPGAMPSPAQSQSVAFTPEYNTQRAQMAPRPGQGISAQGGNLTDSLTQRLVQQAGIYAQHGDFDNANKLYEQAVKFLPEVKEISVSMQNGRPVNVVTYKTGKQEVSPFAPTPKVHWVDQGGSVQPVNEYDQQPLGSPFAKTMTPGEKASNGLGWARLRQDEKQFQQGQNAPQYMLTDAGLVVLPKKLGAGQQPSATIVTGPTGEALGRPLKDIPASVNSAIITNAQNLSTARQALALLGGQTVGNAKGDPNATGWKGYLPQDLLNRWDSGGVETRAMIADLGSMVVHDRSGAAVTAAESPRLMPFIPLITDSAATAKKKLERFVQIYEQEQQALTDTYSKDQGYKPSPVKPGKPTPTGSATNAKGWTLHTDANGNQAYVSPDGKQFEEVR